MVKTNGNKSSKVSEKGLKTTYIKLVAQIDTNAYNKLSNVLGQKLSQGYERIVLLLSTPGGSVFHGLTIHNLLKGIPAVVETHNLGSVDSIGVVIYSAGEKRYSVKDARFLLHPINAGIQGSLESEKIQEILNGLEIDLQNIAGTISHCTKRSKDEVLDSIKNRTTLSPTAAKEYGLVTEIKSDLIPQGADFTFIS